MSRHRLKLSLNLYFNFTIPEEPKSIYKPHYHPISSKELRKLNRYAQQLQEVAKWYDETLAGSKVTYFVKDKDEVNSIEITFEKSILCT